MSFHNITAANALHTYSQAKLIGKTQQNKEKGNMRQLTKKITKKTTIRTNISEHNNKDGCIGMLDIAWKKFNPTKNSTQMRDEEKA